MWFISCLRTSSRPSNSILFTMCLRIPWLRSQKRRSAVAAGLPDKRMQELISWQYCSEHGQVLVDGLVRGIHHNVLAIPWVVLARNKIFPSSQPKPGDIRGSSLSPALVFVNVGALDLNFNGPAPCVVCHFDP